MARKITTDDGRAALAAVSGAAAAGGEPVRADLGTGVRYLLQLLAEKAPATPKALEQQAEVWRPWRSYAAMHLWQSLTRTP